MTDWAVVVPIKRFSDGKLRLGPRPDRAALAEAFAQDCLAAVAGSTRIALLVVVSDDPVLVEELQLPVPVLGHLHPRRDINGAIAAGLTRAELEWPLLPRAVLTADLPALRSEDLDHALGLADAVERGMVPDLHGTGTVMITGRARVPLRPAFGVGSARRHSTLGHRLLPAQAGLRRDVDTAADLEEAIRLGVGPHTASTLGLVSGGSQSIASVGSIRSA